MLSVWTGSSVKFCSLVQSKFNIVMPYIKQDIAELFTKQHNFRLDLDLNAAEMMILSLIC